ncbi:MAG: prenyltransferase [Thiotrichales bacterium]|nr:MAG: prenyltransferase [Thiotrichales bacterium]
MHTLFQSIRPSFLILTPICVFLGTSTALATQASVDPVALALIVIGAVCAHISVNTLNEYADFKSGLDLITIKTPFSGGSGALPANPAMANMVLATGLVTLSITAAVGLYFVNTHGLPVLAIGIIGTAIILTYTRWINRWALLCLIAPGLGFGILMVVGTHYVLTQEISMAAWLAALVPFFLVNNLLLLNQFPDIDADRSIGRRHLPITSGPRISSYVYGALSISAYLVILLGIYYGHFPLLSLIATVPVLLSLFSLRGALRHGDKIGAHQQYLGANVAVTLLVPALLGISIIIA